MLSVIADVLKNRLTDLPWMERFGGMVSAAHKPLTKPGADGAQVQYGTQVSPVAFGVNAENCWESDRWKYFEPDSSKAAISFFTGNGNWRIKSIEGPKNAWAVIEFDIKFLCWMNTARLGATITAGGENPSDRVTPYVINKFFGAQSVAGLFGGGMEEDVFREIEIKGIRGLDKNPSMFEPFSFARDGVNKNLFIYPYDYFGLSISGTFRFNINCLPEFGVDWEPFAGCLSPIAGDTTPGNGTSNWFFNQMQTYNASLGDYPDNETAKAALEVIYGVGNATGKEYYLSSLSDIGARGTKMKVW